jgi:hypothetical protein
MKVARRVMAGLWPEEGGVPGLVMWRGEFWEWKGERWRKVSRQVVEDRVRLGLEDAWVGAGEVMRRYGVNSGKVAEVVDALETVARQDGRAAHDRIGDIARGGDNHHDKGNRHLWRHGARLSAALCAAYEREHAAYCQALCSFCTARGVGYIRADTDQPFDELVLRALRQGGFVR